MKKIHYHLYGRKENAIYLFESLETSEVPRSLTEPNINAMDLNPNQATPSSNIRAVSNLNNMDINKSVDDETLSSELKGNTTQRKKRMISAISSPPTSFFQTKKPKPPLRSSSASRGTCEHMILGVLNIFELWQNQIKSRLTF